MGLFLSLESTGFDLEDFNFLVRAWSDSLSLLAFPFRVLALGAVVIAPTGKGAGFSLRDLRYAFAFLYDLLELHRNCLTIGPIGQAAW
jgi:hypothetical protein